MADRMERRGISIDQEILEKRLNTKVAVVSTRKKQGIDNLKELITNYKNISTEPCVDATVIDSEYFGGLKSAFPQQDIYKLWLVITQDANFVNLDRNLVKDTSAFSTKSKSELKRINKFFKPT